MPADTLTELDATGWELYHVAEDFAENHNLADQDRPRLIELIAQWYVEAGRYHVLPVDGRGQQRFAEERPVIAADRNRYTYYPGTQEVAASAARGSSTGPTASTPGSRSPTAVPRACSCRRAGSTADSPSSSRATGLRYTYNYVAEQQFQVVSEVEVPTGKHVLSFEFEPTGEPEPLKGIGAPGIAKLFIDGEPAGQGELPVTIPLALGLASGVSIGQDAGAPVTDEYRPAVPVHRHPPPRRLRRLRQTGRRPRSRNPHRPRPPIASIVCRLVCL